MPSSGHCIKLFIIFLKWRNLLTTAELDDTIKIKNLLKWDYSEFNRLYKKCLDKNKEKKVYLREQLLLI